MYNLYSRNKKKYKNELQNCRRQLASSLTTPVTCNLLSQLLYLFSVPKEKYRPPRTQNGQKKMKNVMTFV